MRVTRKIVTRAATNLAFLIDFPEILFFLLSFLLLFSILALFCFVFACLFFEIKNIYPDTHSTMRAGE